MTLEDKIWESIGSDISWLGAIIIQMEKYRSDEIKDRILIAKIDIKWINYIKEFIKIKDELIEEAINLTNMFIDGLESTSRTEEMRLLIVNSTLIDAIGTKIFEPGSETGFAIYAKPEKTIEIIKNFLSTL